MRLHPPSAGESYINGVGCAWPETTVSQPQAIEFLTRHYGPQLTARSLGLIHRIVGHPSIKERHLALTDLDLLVRESADQRVARFTSEAVRLAAQAARRALDHASCPTAAVSALVVNTCTGYVCPGLSTYLAEELGLHPRAKLFDLVGSGCGGAIPNLQLASSLLAAEGQGVVVSISVEICSATFQMGNDLSLIVSNALFGDGAAAAVLSSRPGGWRLLHTASRTRPEHREAVRYIHKDGALHNQLAKEVPELAAALVPQVVHDLLATCRITHREVGHWALHPGGDRVIAALEEALGLAERVLIPTRRILRDHGNMSSPTVWFIVEEIAATALPGEYCLMAAFGAGFSAHTCLLQRC